MLGRRVSVLGPKSCSVLCLTVLCTPVNAILIYDVMENGCDTGDCETKNDRLTIYVMAVYVAI